MTTSLAKRVRTRNYLVALLFASLAIAAFLIAPAVPHTNLSATKTARNTQKPDATAQMSAAMSSLQSGQGLPGLGQLSCTPTGLGSAYCGTYLSAPAISSSASPSWTNLTPIGNSPSARDGAPMVYDAADGYVVLFGGAPGKVAGFGDTWKFIAGSWTNITSSIGPSARALNSMVYDAADGYVILFGGIDLKSSFLFDDTWKFVGGSWTNITSTASPSARVGSRMVYDNADHYVILFGGSSFSATFGDTWKFLGGLWTNITPVGGPSSRSYAPMAYDTADGYVVLFGGAVPGSTGYNPIYQDTWKFLAGSWTNITASGGPSSRFGGDMAYDVADGYVVLFGGDSSYYALGDTWRFLGGSWTNITPSSNPSPRGAPMAYDVADGYVVLFGGATTPVTGSIITVVGDTWKFVGGSWTDITPSNGLSPSARFDSSMAYDAADGYVLLFGGSPPSTCGCFGLGDTWKFVGGSWTNITSSSGPSPRTSASMAYDGADGYIVLFGGYTFRTASTSSLIVFGDTWKFVGGSWTNITSTIHPSPRDETSMAYDATDGYVILFGGSPQSTPTLLGDTWKFLAGSWTNITSSGGPPPRVAAAMAYDVADGYVLLFSGYTGSFGPGDTWKFVGGSWTNITPRISPYSRNGGSMAYDAAEGYVVLFGGDIGSDTWKFLGGSWTDITSSSGPLPSSRSAASMAYDAADGYVILFGGIPIATNSAYSDTWKFVGVIAPSPDTTSTTIPNLSCNIPFGGTSCTASVTATVIDTTTSTKVPTGTVTFTLTAGTTGGSLNTNTCTLSAGNCSVMFTGTTAGSGSVTASYGGDATHNSSTSSAATVTVTITPKDSTSISVGAVSCTIPLGGSSCTATVVATVADTTASTNAPTGIVTFALTPGPTGGSLSSTSCTLSITSSVTSCSVMFTGHSAGSGSVTGSYGGDATHKTSTSAVTGVTVAATAKDNTSTTVSCNPNVISLGGTSTCTATVADTTNIANVPGGSATFTSSDATVGTVGASCTLTGGTCSVTFTDIAAGTATVTGTYVSDGTHDGSSGTSSTITVSSPTSKPVLLTFNGFDLDDYDNNMGQLQVFVNNHLVVDIPSGLNRLGGSGDYTSYANTWVTFGPFDITSFVVNGQNNVTFIDPTGAHYGRVRNVTIVQGATILLHVLRAAAVFPDHSVTYTFSIPPLVISSFTISDVNLNVGEHVTFTATFTGGTGPFKCVFQFGDDESRTVSAAGRSCSVTHDYDYSGEFTARVTIIGSSTSDRVSSSLTVGVLASDHALNASAGVHGVDSMALQDNNDQRTDSIEHDLGI